jgi:predicted Zn-ribbon and HTH transcriptional regulator
MKMHIVSCPHCGTYLLQDTAQCHACGHVIDQRSASQLKQVKTRGLPTDEAVSDDMTECPSCHESCRNGLVRCWNCSSFLRPEIEESYRRKQESSRFQMEYVDLPVLDATEVTEEDSLQQREATPESLYTARPYAVEDSAGDDDFDLSSDAGFLTEAPLGYDTENFARSKPLEGTPVAMDSETFSLMYAESDPQSPIEPHAIVESEELPLRGELVEPEVRSESALPPVRVEMPPPSQQEVESSAAADLLKIAADEEQDIQKVRKSLRSKDSFVIFCPQGCRIRVKERHRGKAGKCPRCNSEFVVPRKVVPKKIDNPAMAGSEPMLASRYKKWLGDIRLHTVDPQKLRIKADSLLNECQAVDVGFSVEDILLATLIAGKFGANPKKVAPVRQAMIEHFLKQGAVDQLTIPAKKILLKDVFSLFMVAQPAPNGTESLFADIPVFGTNRIAVRIPKQADSPLPQYLSFCLSEFRAFVEGMQGVCGLEGFGTNVDVPLTDEYAMFKCNISGVPVRELGKINYYVKDPGFKLEVTGWRCAGCQIVLSEAARLEAKLGGANGKGIAKAKCPKCTQKFGDQPLYQVVGQTSEQPAAEAVGEPSTD